MNNQDYLEAIFPLQKEYLGDQKEINEILPLVSVHVITYQHVNFIRECLDGILMQKTNFAIEIVIGEDASTDGTREVCKEYAEKHPDKIRLFLRDRNHTVRTNTDRTVYFNGKLASKSCRGKYIALCEGDDYWTDPLKLQKQIDFLEANPDYSICFHDAIYLYEDGKKDQPLKYSKEVYLLEDLLRSNFITTASCVFRNKLFVKYPEWVFKLPFGDWALHIINAQHGNIKFISDAMAVYRIHSGGMWSGSWSAGDITKTANALVHKIHFYNLLTIYLNKRYEKIINDQLMHLNYDLLQIYSNYKNLNYKSTTVLYCIKNNFFNDVYSKKEIIKALIKTLVNTFIIR